MLSSPWLSFATRNPTRPRRRLMRLAVEALEDRRVPAVILSDSFNRADADQYHLGTVDNALGGSGVHQYLPMFGATQILNHTGATITSGALHNGTDAQLQDGGFGGVEISDANNPSDNPQQPHFNSVGENLGQDLNVAVDLSVPTDQSRVTKGGIYFRAPAHQQGSDIGGGASNGGYWVELYSNGAVAVRDLKTDQDVAVTAIPANFDFFVMHHLEIAAGGSSLQVALDGDLQTFTQGGQQTTTVSIPTNTTGTAGSVGLAFGPPGNGTPFASLNGTFFSSTVQSAKNLKVSDFGALTLNPPPGSGSGSAPGGSSAPTGMSGSGTTTGSPAEAADLLSGIIGAQKVLLKKTRAVLTRKTLGPKIAKNATAIANGLLEAANTFLNLSDPRLKALGQQLLDLDDQLRADIAKIEARLARQRSARSVNQLIRPDVKDVLNLQKEGLVDVQTGLKLLNGN
jgi:hypothetical protein